MEEKNLDIQFSNKVLIFATEYLPVVNNTILAIKGITDHIDTIKFDMITVKGNKELSAFDRVGKINVYRIGVGIAFIDKYILAFWGHRLAQKMHLEKKYSAIWGVGSDHSGFSAMFFKVNNPGIPFFLSLQNEDDPLHLRKKLGFFDPWFRKIFYLADHIQCVNRSLEQWARKMGAYKDISIIPNGIEYDDFATGPLREFHINELKEKLGITKDDKVILAGSARNKKLTKNLITALSFFCEMEKHPIKLVLFDPGRHFNAFKRLANKLFISSKIVFVDKISYTMLPHYFWISDLFIDLSERNPAGTLLLEAMASRTALMEAKESAAPFYMKDQENCLFYNPLDTFDIADKIKTFLLEQTIRHRIIENAEKIAKEQLDYEKIKEKMEKIYDQIFKDRA